MAESAVGGLEEYLKKWNNCNDEGVYWTLLFFDSQNVVRPFGIHTLKLLNYFALSGGGIFVVHNCIARTQLCACTRNTIHSTAPSFRRKKADLIEKMHS